MWNFLFKTSVKVFIKTLKFIVVGFVFEISNHLLSAIVLISNAKLLQYDLTDVYVTDRKTVGTKF